MEDSAIIELFRQRSEDALAEAAAKYNRYCLKIAVNILRNDEDARECVSETWFRAWRAIPPACPDRLDAFRDRITRNIALNRYEAMRTRKRGGGEVELSLDELHDIAAPETAPEGEITRVINTFLRSGPAEYSDIFLKRYWYLCSIKSIAAEYGCSESRIASLLLRMRKKLRKKLEREALFR